ncbi:DUF6207 family protein [Streptomyces sp. NPDC003442]
MLLIDEVHMSEPGLVVLDIAARDEETAVAVMSWLDQLWATPGVGSVRRVAGEPGVSRGCVYEDIRRPDSPGPR